MKVIEYLNSYVIKYQEITTDMKLREVQVNYNLINGRTVILDIIYEINTNKVIEISTDLSIDNEDIREIVELKWKIGEPKEILRLKLPQLLLFHEGSNIVVVAYLPNKHKSLVSQQVRDILEETHNVIFRPNYFLYKDMKKNYQYLPIQETGMEFFTYSEFIQLPHIQTLPHHDKGLAYARFYRNLKTHVLACRDLNINPTFIYGSGTNSGKIAFKQNNYYIEEIQILKPVYVGKFEGKKVVHVTYHSHNVQQNHTSDIVIFCYINDGMLERQWIVYTNPAFDLGTDFYPTIKALIDRVVEDAELRALQVNQPIQSAKSNGYYLVPKFLEIENNLALK